MVDLKKMKVYHKSIYFILLEHKTGIPIFYDLYPGSIIDQTHLEMAIKHPTHNLKT